jgi:hypothetical protein
MQQQFRGALPADLIEADDALLDLQCCVDAQQQNTQHLLRDMREATADGRISPDEWDHFVKHVRLEDGLNDEANAMAGEIRRQFKALAALVRSGWGVLKGRKPASTGSRVAA